MHNCKSYRASTTFDELTQEPKPKYKLYLLNTTEVDNIGAILELKTTPSRVKPTPTTKLSELQISRVKSIPCITIY